MCLSGPDGLVSLFLTYFMTVHKVYTRTHQREVIGPSFEPAALRYTLIKYYCVCISFLDLFYYF